MVISNKLIEAAKKVLQAMVISLVEINDTMEIAKYAISLLYSKQEYKLDPDSAITDASSILKFISKLGAFFPQVKLKRGKSYTNILYILLI